MHLAQTRLTIETRCLLMLMLCFAGCGKSERLDDAYGTRRGDGAKSVNGTSVLSDMFDDAGFRSGDHLDRQADLTTVRRQVRITC